MTIELPVTHTMGMPAHVDRRPLAASFIARKLGEKDKRWLVRKIVYAWGIQFAMAEYNKALKVEAEGGMLTTDGVRRTPGGVFFRLVKDAKRGTPEFGSVFYGTKRKPPKAPEPGAAPTAEAAPVVEVSPAAEDDAA